MSSAYTHMSNPTNNALLINLQLSSDAEVLSNIKHGLSMQVGGQTCKKKTCVQRVHVLTELLILHTTFGGWVSCEGSCMEET